MPMVWYVPPLSPVVDRLTETGHDGEAAGNLFGAIDALRIPIEYLAELFTAGDPEPVTAVLRSARRDALLHARRHPRPAPRRVDRRRGRDDRRPSSWRCTGCWASPSTRSATSSPPPTRGEAHQLEELGCSLDVDGGPGMVGSGPFGEASGRPVPVSVETFHALRDRQTSDQIADPGRPGARINLLNWDGKGRPDGLFPPQRDRRARTPMSAP